MAHHSGLYVTATPIGNLGDMTARAIEILKHADLILCEDTRVSAKLMRAFDIKTPTKPYHDHNGETVRPIVLERLAAGETIALVSDAGTPLISDPGYKLVKAVKDAGLRVFTVPGASALTAALSIAGAPTDRFFFAGFLPAKSGARQKEIASLASVPASLVFYETGPRLAASLEDMLGALGNRHACVLRELTKLHEESLDGSLSELVALASERTLKGEIVVVVHPPETKAWNPEEVDYLLASLLKSESVKDAASIAAEKTGLPRKELYSRALDLRS